MVQVGCSFLVAHLFTRTRPLSFRILIEIKGVVAQDDGKCPHRSTKPLHQRSNTYLMCKNELKGDTEYKHVLRNQ